MTPGKSLTSRRNFVQGCSNSSEADAYQVMPPTPLLQEVLVLVRRIGHETLAMRYMYFSTLRETASFVE